MFAHAHRLCLLSVTLLGGGLAEAAESTERSISAARITQIASLPVADLILIDAGFGAGLRQGMVCTVSREGTALGELILVDLRLQAASGLILDLNSGQSFRSGDLVTVKTVSARK